MIVNRQSCSGGVGERAPGYVEPIGETSVEHSESVLAIASVSHEGAPISAGKITVDYRVIVPRLL